MSLKQSSISPLELERSSLSFPINELIPLIHGSHSAAQEFISYQKTIAEDPVLRFNPEMLGESRVDRFNMMCKKAVRYNELFDLNCERKKQFRCVQQFPEVTFGGLHQGMFIPTILNLGNEEQVAKWLPLAESNRILGCYAQTELGHGSDVQSLETEAVFDLKTDSFIINSPSLSATKWWIGELGVVANYTVTMAQLILNGKKYGPQAFLVPIRDLNTHEPLLGITVGDIGPKLGYNTKDNGFLRFNNVSIPRENLLARYVKVSKSGEFKRVGNEKIGYATMMGVRANIILNAASYLAKFLTIGVRYSLVRTQFKDERGLEMKTLDYQLQQEKLIPLIADNYAILFASKRITALTRKNMENAKIGDFSLMQDLHAILSGCKAVYTWIVLFGGEKIRQACGGHGYSLYSGFGALQEYAPNATYEGENTVMLLQTSRYLMKNLKKVDDGKTVSDFVGYLRDYNEEIKNICLAKEEIEFHDQEVLRKILRYDAIFKVFEARQKLMDGVSKDLSGKDSWDKHAGIDLVESAMAHINYFTFLTFADEVAKVSNEKVKAVLLRLLNLFAVNRILEKPKGLFESGYLNVEQFRILRNIKNELLKSLRNDALGLVEAFLFSDNALASALGQSDGKVYETLWDWMKNKNKMNEPGVHKKLMKQLRSGL